MLRLARESQTRESLSIAKSHKAGFGPVGFGPSIVARESCVGYHLAMPTTAERQGASAPIVCINESVNSFDYHLQPVEDHAGAMKTNFSARYLVRIRVTARQTNSPTTTL